MLAAECLARAIARGVYEATPLPFAGALRAEAEVVAASATAPRCIAVEPDRPR